MQKHPCDNRLSPLVCLISATEMRDHDPAWHARQGFTGKGSFYRLVSQGQVLSMKLNQEEGKSRHEAVHMNVSGLYGLLAQTG